MKHDFFSRRAAGYARYRPRYPAELFAYLANLAPARSCSCDCATGNGQAAGSLARQFDRVIATDASRQQLIHAVPHERIAYVVATGEAIPVANRSVDVVTIAQALHWLAVDAFFREARRVLRPSGVIAVWCYTGRRSTPDLDAVLDEFYSHRVGRYWLPQRQLVEDGYGSVPFPFDEIDTPPFTAQVRWSLADLLGYLQTWSAVQRAQAAGDDPMPELSEALGDCWGPVEQERVLSFPLALRVGRVP